MKEKIDYKKSYSDKKKSEERNNYSVALLLFSIIGLGCFFGLIFILVSLSFSSISAVTCAYLISFILVAPLFEILVNYKKGG